MNTNEYNYINTPMVEEDTLMDVSLSTVNQVAFEDIGYIPIELQVYFTF